MEDQLLSPYRVLDLTNEKGYLCGKILGDLGADVVKVELPGGDPARNIGPFYHDTPDPEKSLYWFAYNTSKRGITLNTETTDGREIFNRLVKTADVVIESFMPGYMDNLGLGYSDLSQINPQLIMTSITPFGQTGPYSHYKASDIICWAMGGIMYLMGDPDRPPLQISFPQAYLHGAAAAAAHTMAALYYRGLTGEGQYVDVAVQPYIVFSQMAANRYWDTMQMIVKRGGSVRIRPDTGAIQRTVWPCKDGYVNFLLRGGSPGARFNRPLVEWMDSEGAAEDFLKALDWDTLNWDTESPEFTNLIQDAIGRFFISHTKDELYQGAKKRHIIIYPVSDIKDILESAQLADRDFWVNVEHPELGANITYPGAFIKGSVDICKIRRRAPLIGEHNEEVYHQEMGFSIDELIVLKQAGVI